MTQSVPDSFNLDELSAMLENAPQEDDLHSSDTNSDKEITPELIEDAAEQALNFATELCPDPLVHKLMMMAICNRMIQWHTSIGEKQYEDDNTEAAICWLRDAGKFQNMMDSLLNIAIGPDDFTCNQE